MERASHFYFLEKKKWMVFRNSWDTPILDFNKPFTSASWSNIPIAIFYVHHGWEIDQNGTMGTAEALRWCIFICHEKRCFENQRLPWGEAEEFCGRSQGKDRNHWQDWNRKIYFYQLFTKVRKNGSIYIFVFFFARSYFEKVLVVLRDVESLWLLETWNDCQLFPNEINGDCVSCWNATARK